MKMVRSDEDCDDGGGHPKVCGTVDYFGMVTRVRRNFATEEKGLGKRMKDEMWN
jgi:hypothetical protein